MRQVFTNLIINALEALPKDGGVLILRVSDSGDWKDSNSSGVRVTVADTGSGIAQTHLDRIFSGTFTTKGIKSNGVGLWMAKKMIENQRGSIRVRSRITPRQSWTCFSVFLPSNPIQFRA